MELSALSVPESEACGFIYSDHYIPLPNQSPDGSKFDASPESIAHALARFGEPAAIFHTHPNGILHPSPQDVTRWHYPRSVLIIGTITGCLLKYKAFCNAGETVETVHDS